MKVFGDILLINNEKFVILHNIINESAAFVPHFT